MTLERICNYIHGKEIIIYLFLILPFKITRLNPRKYVTLMMIIMYNRMILTRECVLDNLIVDTTI